MKMARHSGEYYINKAEKSGLEVKCGKGDHFKWIRLPYVDEFLHKIQQAEMRELWDNKEDEVWENV